MWVEFVVGSLLCFERFFSGYSGFPLSSKTNTSKFQFDQESGRRRTTLWMCYLQIIIYLFIYSFVMFSICSPQTRPSIFLWWTSRSLTIKPGYQTTPDHQNRKEDQTTTDPRQTRPPNQITPPDHRPRALTTRPPISTAYQTL